MTSTPVALRRRFGAGSEIIRRRRLSDEVVSRLEAMIHDGRYPPGDRLPSERELMQMFGVGRPAVREALFSLQKMGLVAIQAGDRARVTRPTTGGRGRGPVGRGPAPAGGAGRHREPAGCATVLRGGPCPPCGRAPDGERPRGSCAAALDANKPAIGDLERFERTDVAFHYMLAVIAKNPIFTALHAAIVEWLVEQRHTTLSWPRPQGNVQEGLRGARGDLRGDRGRDPRRGREAAMRDHLAHVAEVYWEAKGGGAMSGFVIIVDFKLKPGARATFRKLIDANAATSVRDEPGCRRFDVLEPEGEDDRIVLYEIYDHRADVRCAYRNRALSRPSTRQARIW